MDVYILDQVGYEVCGGYAYAYRTMLDAMREVPRWGGWKLYTAGERHPTWIPTKFRRNDGSWDPRDTTYGEGVEIVRQTLADPIKRPELRGA